jgi:RimK family alpha-L-glutamate ligase
MSPLLVAGNLTPTNVRLRETAARLCGSARLLPAELAAARARPGEIVLGRVDVSPSLDGPQNGLDGLRELAAAGTLVLNRADALLVAHDKRETARLLAACGLPHPRTTWVPPGGDLPELDLPFVLKPRFGSWGTDVLRCRTRRELRHAVARVRRRPWFWAHGVVAQELLPTPAADLRLVVAGGAVVGAVAREPAPGEWRTNVALGGVRRPVEPPAEAMRLALAAAAAAGLDLVGVDLLPTPSGWTILELNGCVDLADEYAILGGDVFEDAIVALLFPHVATLGRSREDV